MDDVVGRAAGDGGSRWELEQQQNRGAAAGAGLRAADSWRAGWDAMQGETAAQVQDKGDTSIHTWGLTTSSGAAMVPSSRCEERGAHGPPSHTGRNC